MPFLFSNSYPSNNIKVYGTEQIIGSTVTVSGLGDTYDSKFYYSSGNLITTLSGTNSGTEASITMATTSGTIYSWYIETTSSGITDRSPDYTFYVRYLCSGICNDYGIPASGINVRAYRRSTGELVGETTTAAGTGTFAIDTEFNEEHYTVALNPDSTYNALIYDRVKP